MNNAWAGFWSQAFASIVFLAIFWAVFVAGTITQLLIWTEGINWDLDLCRNFICSILFTFSLFRFKLLPRETWLGPYASGNSEPKENSWSWTASGKQCKYGRGRGAPQHAASSLLDPSLSFHKFDTDTSKVLHLLPVLSLTPATHSGL